MKIFKFSIFQFIIATLILSTSLFGQNYDLLIKGGTIIDAKNGRNDIIDVAILNGKIAEINPDIFTKQSKKVIYAKGMLVTPGLVDLHGYIFFGTDEMKKRDTVMA